MGFTRYWEFVGKKDVNKFKEFSNTCQIIIDNMDVPLDDVIISETQVRLNGVDEDGHETFNFHLDREGLNFCKTNRKPYDDVVFACLYIAKIIFGENIKIISYDNDDVVRKVKSILRENKLGKILN